MERLRPFVVQVCYRLSRFAKGAVALGDSTRLTRMRQATSVLSLLLIAGSIFAQAPSSDYTVRANSVEIRGGRSSIFPVTGYLRQGQPVKAIREENGWLAIAPPAGSSSWVMERVLDPQPLRGQRTICVLLADDAPILLGTNTHPQPHPHEVNKGKRGTMVVVLGEQATSDALGEKTTWWRIQPLNNEVRWVNKEAVQGATTANQPSMRPNSNASTQPAPIVGQPVNRPSYAPIQPAPTGVVMTSGPGMLRRAAFQIDGQPAFVLEDTRGYPRIYAIAQPGLNLEPFNNRRVELFGPMVQRPDFGGRGYMHVKQLYLLR